MLDLLQSDIRHLTAAYEELSDEEQMLLSCSMGYIQAIRIEIDRIREAADTIGQGAGINFEESGLENSWRYLNGEAVSDVLDIIEHEVQEVSAREANEAAPDVGQEINEDVWNIDQKASEGAPLISRDEGDYTDEGASANEATDMIEYFVGDGITYQGIDVSRHQGYIDWQEVKDAGIDFAIIRCGYGGDYASQDDVRWEYNASSCESLGIPYGVYLYSYADSTSRIDSEVQHTLRLLQGYKPTLPVYIDIEENSQFALGGAVLSSLAERFCRQISDAGYRTGLYTSTSYWNAYFAAFAEIPGYYHWVAEYNSRCSYSGRYETWQHTNTGRVNGIEGNVDRDIWYGEFPAEPVSIEKASVAGVSLSYGYSGKAYKPALTVKVNGATLVKDTDYTVSYENNTNPGTATITISGKGKYTGTRIKKFEIVDCVSSPVSGRTYQLIPKNNSATAVSSYSGKMVNNTKVYITNRSGSEAMRFKAVRNSDGTWKFINAKCELALAVRKNSSELGAGIVLHDQTSKDAQNWKLSKKSDNSFAILNKVTGYSIAMSDSSAVKGTTLSMAESASSGLQRFYIAEVAEVDASFDGAYSIRASKDRGFALHIASSQAEEGANVTLAAYSDTDGQRFKAMYSGSDYYRLVNMNSGLVLSVDGNTNRDGANVIQSRWQAQSGQRWKIAQNSDGTVTFTNALGTVLHLVSNRTVSGTNIVSKMASATKAQRWYLERWDHRGIIAGDV
ncbi:MAG: RICIN domain-containing protein [Lachnospiraceae bacterium]|nr:RICIN domain-containing protein [Lachnospiraceae bacterium]